MKRRMHAALLSVLALILGTGALVLTGVGPATADDVTGTVTLTATGSSTADVPAFSKVSVSAPCPAPYQDKLDVLVVMPNGRESILASNLTDGAPFSGATITAQTPAASTDTITLRSIAGAFSVLHATMTDGTYPIHVLCKSDDAANTAKPTFTTAIDIAGTTWAQKVVTPPTTTSLTLAGDPKFQVVDHDVTLTATVTPADAVGTVSFSRSNSPMGAPVALANGRATITLPGVGAPGGTPVDATFVPTDGLVFASSSAHLDYSFVSEPGITVLDDSGNAVTDTPTLTKGEKLKVTADGFLTFVGSDGPEKVHVTLDSGTPALPDATPDGQGKVSNYELTLPDDLADGTHSLVLKGATSAITQTFAFKTGAAASDGGSSDGGSSDGGSSDGGSSTDGTSTGATSDGGSSTGGTSTGGTSGGGSTTGGSSTGGSNGPLAATGANGAIPLSVLALLMITGGGYAVYRVRRDGKLLGFGPTPRD